MRSARLCYSTCLVMCFVMVVSCGDGWGKEMDVYMSSSLSYLNFGQFGRRGFFGEYDKDRTTGAEGALASMNGWLGSQVGDLVSGSVASRGSSSSNFFVSARANEALALKGSYRVSGGDWGYNPGQQQAYAVGQWTQLFVTVETPWGVLSYGKRPFGFGTGLQYCEGNRTEEYLALVADYGPFQIGGGAYLARVPDRLGEIRNTYWNNSDVAGNRQDGFAFFKYAAGMMECGAGSITAAFQQSPQSQVNQVARGQVPRVDTFLTEGFVYTKYFNSRFFFNAEADWYYRTEKYGGTMSGQFLFVTYGPPNLVTQQMNRTPGYGSLFRPNYVESWRYAIETGVVGGPSKTSFIFGYVPGPDRRGGVLIDKQPVRVDPYQRDFDALMWDPDLGNNGLFGPYSMIFVTSYASGVGAYDRSGSGQLADATMLAARFDYAIAANLNIFATGMKAWRNSKAYGWGYIQPTLARGVPVNPFSNTQTTTVGQGSITYGVPRYVGREAAPNIPDNDLGWEINAGLSWDLISGFNLNATGGFWQPGRWFNYACVDRSVQDWDAKQPEMRWGIKPNRVIDPIYGFQFMLSASF